MMQHRWCWSRRLQTRHFCRNPHVLRDGRRRGRAPDSHSFASCCGLVHFRGRLRARFEMRSRASIFVAFVAMFLALHSAFGSEATIRLELPFGHRPSPPESHNVVLGADVTFVVFAEEDPLLAVQWQLNGSNIV